MYYRCFSKFPVKKRVFIHKDSSTFDGIITDIKFMINGCVCLTTYYITFDDSSLDDWYHDYEVFDRKFKE